jgi:hypothetical protein
MMATIEHAAYIRTVTFPEVMALIGGHYYPLVIPQDVDSPAIAYQVISSPRTRSHSGDSQFTTTRFQFTCQAASYEMAKALAKAVRHAWESFRGNVAGINIQGAFVENELDSSPDVPVRRVDVRIQHDED